MWRRLQVGVWFLSAEKHKSQFWLEAGVSCSDNQPAPPLHSLVEGQCDDQSKGAYLIPSTHSYLKSWPLSSDETSSTWIWSQSYGAFGKRRERGRNVTG